MQSQQIIEHWIQLHNRMTGASYRITTPSCGEPLDTGASVVCADRDGHLIALEHALIRIRNEEAGTRCLLIKTLECELLKLSFANADKRVLLARKRFGCRLD